MPPLSLRRIHGAIERNGAEWSAGPTDVARLDAHARAGLCGVVVDEAALAEAMRPRRTRGVVTFDPVVDWRDRGGSHVTAIEDQRRCGSCVSFATAALVGSMASIEHGRLLDLSEADLHFCSPHGASCGGWWPDPALAWARDTGLVEDRLAPYAAAFASPPVADPADPGVWQPRCGGAPADGRRVRISRFEAIADVPSRKAHLTRTGPMLAVMEDFDDLYAYRTGVYRHVSGTSAASTRCSSSATRSSTARGS